MYLFIGTMAQASLWARSNNVNPRDVIPATRGDHPWRGLSVPPTIIDTGARITGRDAIAVHVALDAVAIIAATMRIEDSLDQALVDHTMKVIAERRATLPPRTLREDLERRRA